MQIASILPLNIMKNHMEKVFSHWHRIICVQMVLYLFDEPEAALSPQRQLTLLMQIYNCAKEGAQFIIVTHSPILLGIPDADIYCFDNGRIHLCEYEETESYQVTEMFINNRRMLLNRLLTD